jgi:hypothetical protein
MEILPMTPIQALRRIGGLAAAAMLATSIGTMPLLADDGDQSAPPAGAHGKKTAAQKKTIADESKRKQPADAKVQPAASGYRPDPTPGSGY